MQTLVLDDPGAGQDRADTGKATIRPVHTRRHLRGDPTESFLQTIGARCEAPPWNTVYEKLKVGSHRILSTVQQPEHTK